MSEGAETPRQRQYQKILEAKNRKEEEQWVSLSEAVGIEDTDAQNDIQRAEDRATLEPMLSKLPARWRDVLKHRYLEDEPMTFESIGKKLGVTAERASQIESYALSKLRVQIIVNEEKGIPSR